MGQPHMGQPMHPPLTQPPELAGVVLGGVVPEDVTQPGLFAGVGGVSVSLFSQSHSIPRS